MMRKAMKGGVYLEESKVESTIEDLPVPQRLVIPLKPVSYTHLTLPTKRIV